MESLKNDKLKVTKIKKNIKDFQKRPRKNYITTCIFERGQKKKNKKQKKKQKKQKFLGKCRTCRVCIVTYSLIQYEYVECTH